MTSEPAVQSSSTPDSTTRTLSDINPVLESSPADFLAPRFWPTWLVLGLLWLIGRLSIRNLQQMGRLLGRLSYRLLRSRRSIARTNLELCFPELEADERERLVESCFEENAVGYFEAASVWFNDPERYRPICRLTGIDNLESAID